LNPKLPLAFVLSAEVARARELGLPVVALESSVITQGLPYPENLGVAEDMERTVRAGGAAPATVAVLDGRVYIGLASDQIQRLATGIGTIKISARDFGPALAKGATGGTTVAGTLLAAHAAGLQVFATGGIGGVHYDLTPRRKGVFDISADLPALASTPMIVVCAGAKAILDLRATLEVLETSNVPVVGYGTSDFPAFYTRQIRNAGLKTSASAYTPDEVVAIARAHWSLGLQSAVLVVVPPPEEAALSEEVMKDAVRRALKEARDQKKRGQEVTPFLLNRVSELTGGASLRANLGLLVNNAAVAAAIARVLTAGQRRNVV
jgi:pseudouridine-5'-phosphate glycosidase